jgi:hypothetical protein
MSQAFPALNSGTLFSRKSIRRSKEAPEFELPVYAILKSVALDKSALGKSPLSANLRAADLGL